VFVDFVEQAIATNVGAIAYFLDKLSSCDDFSVIDIT